MLKYETISSHKFVYLNNFLPLKKNAELKVFPASKADFNAKKIFRLLVIPDYIWIYAGKPKNIYGLSIIL